MITDELLNKYIDNELSEAELKELTERLKNDTDAQLRLKALHLTDDILRKIEVSPAPENFTQKFMSKISISTSSVKDKVSYFYIGMISFFALAIAVILGFSISRIESNLSFQLFLIICLACIKVTVLILKIEMRQIIKKEKSNLC